jgi:hypothetical protein
MTKDRLKEEIGLFKLLMTIAAAIFTSIVSWFWNNYLNSSFAAKFLVGFLIIYCAVMIVFLFLTTNKKIKELDYL